MQLNIVKASMSQREDGTYAGQVVFSLERFSSTYEITFFSKKGKEWDYSLNFTEQSGSEEEMLAMDELLEEDDDLFEQLLAAAKQQMNHDA